MNFELKIRLQPAGTAPSRPPSLGKPFLAAPRGLARLAAAGLIAAALALSFGSPPAASAEVTEVEKVRDRVLSDGRYQTDQPEAEEIEDSEPLHIPPWLVETILWTLGLIAVALVLFFLFNLLLEVLGGRSALRRKREGAPETDAVVETPVTLDRETRLRTLAEADALAAEGRFAEAIHLLLLVAMDRLRRELGPKVAPALTSREVLNRTPIPGEVVAPLSRMVALSEIKHFGGREADEPDYQNCRQDFIHFSGGEPQGA